MSVNITTSEYNNTKTATIDGVEFEVRPMSSSEYLTIINISKDMKNMAKDDVDTLGDLLKTIEDMYFSLFNDPDQAKKVLGHLSVDAWMDIYNKIVKD